MKNISILLLLMVTFCMQAQDQLDLKKNMPRRFIDKIEIFAGPNLCFNHGNMFVDRYSSPNFNNHREFKMGYSVGVGVYNPISRRLDLNLKLIWDQKGTNSEFVTAPTDTGYHNLVTTVKSNYSYYYLTLSVLPRILLDKKKKLALFIGGYYSRIINVRANILMDSHSDNFSISSKQSIRGRQVYGIDSNGGITSSGTAIGLISFNDDYGAIIGFSYSISLKKNDRVNIQITENLGLANINKQVFAPPVQNQPEKNNTVCLMIGYTYHRSNKDILD